MSGKPHIAIVVPNLEIGGTERHLLAVLPRLLVRGHEVDILTTRGNGALDDAFAASGVRISHPGGYLRFGKVGIFIWLVLTLRRLRPDIAHFFLPEAYLLGALAALIARVPLRLMSRRSQNYYQKKYPLFALSERRLHHAMHAIIGNSPTVCRELADEGVPDDRLGFIPNGLDTQRFAPGDRASARVALGLPVDAFVMVSVANLYAYKGHADLLDALVAISDELPANWRLLCVGRDHGQGESLRARAVAGGIADHIVWAGEQPDVVPWLQAADIALLCSHEEGSPNSLIEAMAAGLPVIATDVGGISAIVDDGESGYLVPLQSADALGRHIVELAHDENHRHAMAQVARSRTLARFTIERCVDDYSTLYGEHAPRWQGLADALRFDPDRRPATPANASTTDEADAKSQPDGRPRRLGPVFQAAVSLALLATAIAIIVEYAHAPTLIGNLVALPLDMVLLVIATIASGALLAASRLKLLSTDFGYRLTWSESLTALGLGQIGGVLFFQAVGQLAARSAYLARRGLPTSVTVLMFGYERLLSTGISLALAAGGAWIVFGRIALDFERSGDSLVKMTIGITLAIAAGAWFGWGRALAREGIGIVGASSFWRIARAALLSLAIQLATAIGYLILLAWFDLGVSLPDLAAAILVVMFAASLPISFAGWGVRELSAIVVLSAVGVPPDIALIVAAIVGVASLLVVLPLGALALTQKAAARTSRRASADGIDYGRLINMFVPLATATAIFFHLHLPSAAGGLNVNLADPLAMIGGGLFLIATLWQMRLLPQWRLSGFNLHILIATLVLSVALLIGVNRFGWTDWALANKYVGWYVVLAYGSTGALIAMIAGSAGVGILARTFIATGVAIACLELLLEALRSAGFELSERVLWYDANGFAANRNTFAFQMLMAAVLVFVLDIRPGLKVAFTAVLIAVLWFAGSRTGWITMTLLLVLAIYFSRVTLRQAFVAALSGVCLIVAIEYAWIAEWLWADDFARVIDRVAARPDFSLVSDSSFAERLRSYGGGWRLFLDYPVFGAGLGAYVETELRATGNALVIHSTVIWIAAEMGLVGLVAFVTPIGRLFWQEVHAARHSEAARLIVFCIAAFATMSLAHEMLYQRTFWLLLGAGLALQASRDIVTPNRDTS